MTRDRRIQRATPELGRAIAVTVPAERPNHPRLAAALISAIMIALSLLSFITSGV